MSKNSSPASLSRYIATEGMVLLKNEGGVLPLKKGAKVAVFGKGQIDFVKGGTGSGDVHCGHVVSLLEGMENKEKEGKLSVYETIAAKYKEDSSFVPSEEEIGAAVAYADSAIYVITRNSGEGGDRKPEPGDYYLSEDEIKQLDAITKAGFENVIVILNIGGIVDTTKLLGYPQIKSILLAWQPGMDGGDAVADVLVGDVSPSGKLADTFAADFYDYPSSPTFTESEEYAKYTEDIFVGYRYFETFDPNYQKVNFEFGFGLSYTTFALSDMSFTEENGDILVSVKVTNTGKCAGKEVVQVYYAAPQGKLGKPAKELIAFAKTAMLAPDEAQTVTMRFAVNDMASYDDTGKVQKSAYLLEAGAYDIYVGNSVRNAGEAGVRYTYQVEKTIVTKQLTEQVKAKLLEKRLLADGTYEDIYDDSEISVPVGKEYTRIEAEQFYTKHRHADVVFNNAATKSGLKMNTSNEGLRYVVFAVDVEEAGKYNIALGIGNEGEAVENAVVFYVGDKAQTEPTMTLPTTGGLWTTLTVDGKVKLDLKKGVNFVKLEFVCGDKFQGVLNYITLVHEDMADVLVDDPAYTDYRKCVPHTDDDINRSKPAKDGKITFDMLMKNPALMDDFLGQLSLLQLISLLHGHEEKTTAGTGSIGGVEEFGIPAAETADGPAGLRMKSDTTAYPIETMLACTWNPDVLYEMGEAVAKEAEESQVDIWLAPASNIHRNPLCGRNFEYYSEDPYLSGMMASAIISGVQDNGIGTVMKHFLANEKEENRVYSDSRASERALREIYLKPFEIAIGKANPWAIMSSYNKLNGVYTASNYSLLTEILRNEWGYDGMVTSDWWNTSVAYRELVAGEDLKMKSGDVPSVVGAYKCGILSRKDIELHARRVIELIMKTKTAHRA